MVKNQKSCSKLKNAQKYSLKIHKGAGIFEKPQNLSKNGIKHKIIYMEGLISKNKNIKGGVSL